jgi:hypothetical protein
MYVLFIYSTNLLTLATSYFFFLFVDYFEYPSTVALMLYETKYGISLRPASVIVNPLSATVYDFSLGSLLISYNANTKVHIQLPDAHVGTRAFTIGHLKTGTWTVTFTGSQPTPYPVGADGLLKFNGNVGPGIVIDAIFSN